MLTGSVKWFDAGKGYGFILPDSGGSDVFVHISNCSANFGDSLKNGQRVQYEARESPRKNGKLEATNVQMP